MVPQELIRKTRQAWSQYMYYACADVGWDHKAESEASLKYSALSAECRERGIHPFEGVPDDGRPAEWS